MSKNNCNFTLFFTRVVSYKIFESNKIYLMNVWVPTNKKNLRSFHKIFCLFLTNFDSHV